MQSKHTHKELPMKNFYKSSCLISLLSLIGVVHADDMPHRYAKTTYGEVTPIQDIACAMPNASLHQPIERVTTFWLEHNWSTPIYDLAFQLFSNDAFPNALLTFNSLDCDAIIEPHRLVIKRFNPYQRCSGTLLITPPPCPLISEGVYGPLSGKVERYLSFIPKSINATVSTLGAAEDFGILSDILTNDDLQGKAMVNGGNVGSMESHGTIDVSTGNVHYPDGALATQIALQDVQSAYQMFTSNTECIRLGRFLDGFIITPGNYCLDHNLLDSDQTVTLSGKGSFIFYVRSKGMLFGPNSKVVLQNGADENDVYWLVDGEFLLSSGSVLSGNIITSESSPNEIFGEAPSQVNGRILSPAQIDLFGTVVNVPQ